MKFETRCAVFQETEHKNLWLSFVVEAETFGQAEEKTVSEAMTYGTDVKMKAVKLSNIDTAYRSEKEAEDNKWYAVAVQYLVDAEKERYAVTHYLVEAESSNEAIELADEKIIKSSSYDATVVKVEETCIFDIID